MQFFCVVDRSITQMFSDEVRETIRGRLKAGAKVQDLAAEFQISAPAIFLWRRQWSPRGKKVVQQPDPANDWSWPLPESEARFLLRVAVNNGGIERMRELIAVSPEQKANLERLAATGQLSLLHVQRAIIFRQQVLEQFDRLVEKNGGTMSP